MEPFVEIALSRERPDDPLGGQLVRAGSCRKSANRFASAELVSSHPNLNGVVASKLSVGAPLLLGDSPVEAH